MNHAVKAIAHKIKMRQVAYFLLRRRTPLTRRTVA